MRTGTFLSAKIEGAEPPASDERSHSASRAPAPTSRGAGAHDRQAKRADPPPIARAYIAHLARLAVKDIRYEQAGCGRVCTHNRLILPRAGNSGGNKDRGAGDQGIMFGYACRETLELMPSADLAHPILKMTSEARRSGETRALGSDAKSQETSRYDTGKPVTAGVGDPSCALVIAWTFLDPASREHFRSAAELDPATWQRARGWRHGRP
jgi:S-adenosylmethionine synthetase, central domain